MNDFIVLRDLADKLGIDRGNLLKRIKKAGVKTVLAPVLTRAGPQIARWIPAYYALELVKKYEEAKANSKKGEP